MRELKWRSLSKVLAPRKMPSDWLALLAEERTEELDSKLQEFTKPPKPFTSAQFQLCTLRSET